MQIEDQAEGTENESVETEVGAQEPATDESVDDSGDDNGDDDDDEAGFLEDDDAA